jgi:hypothetical protein
MAKNCPKAKGEVDQKKSALLVESWIITSSFLKIFIHGSM